MSNEKPGNEKPKTTNPMSRRWCFTLYPEKIREGGFYIPDDPTGEEGRNAIRAFLRAQIPGWRGLLCSLEEGDTKEHIHLQGYIELHSPCRFKFMKKNIGFGVHLEIARGDRATNYEYICHTENHKDKGTLYWIIEEGDWPRTSGDARNMYDECVEMILEGRSIKYVALKYKGAILPMLGNLKRLQQEVERETEVETAFLEISRRNRERHDLIIAENAMPF